MVCRLLAELDLVESPRLVSGLLLGDAQEFALDALDLGIEPDLMLSTKPTTCLLFLQRAIKKKHEPSELS